MRLFFFAAKLTVCWIATCFILWSLYGMSLEVEQGALTTTAAKLSVIKMSLIITGLVALSWAWIARGHRRVTNRWAKARWAFVSTALLLFLYLVVVLVRRNLWSESQGLSVYSQFLPIVGRVNSVFMSEYKWIIFLFGAIPLVSVLSGLAIYLDRGDRGAGGTPLSH